MFLFSFPFSSFLFLSSPVLGLAMTRGNRLRPYYYQAPPLCRGSLNNGASAANQHPSSTIAPAGNSNAILSLYNNNNNNHNNPKDSICPPSSINLSASPLFPTTDNTGGCSSSSSTGQQGRQAYPPVSSALPSELPLQALTCRVLITADKRNVDADVFEAIHHSGLVYDGRLVVDRRFQVKRKGPSLPLFSCLPPSFFSSTSTNTGDLLQKKTDMQIYMDRDREDSRLSEKEEAEYHEA